MKTRNSTRTLLVLLMLAVGGQGCGGHDPSAPVLRAPIDPVRQPDELSRRLSIIGQNRSGAFPAPSQQGPRILLIQASASVTPDNTLFLPFSYRSDSAVRGLYLSVVGAKNYWDIPLGADDAVHDRVVPIGIPAEALPGDFVLEYSLYDASGQVGARSRLHASVVPPTAGPGGSIEFPRVEGHDGLTVRTYDVGTAAGLVTIDWETFTVPDRVDIRYAGEWIRSTGAPLGVGDAPPIAGCAEVGPADGFVGSSGRFEVQIDPQRGGLVDVYVSGCLNGSTAWNFVVAFTAGAPPCVALAETHTLDQAGFRIPLGLWMYNGTAVANWLGRRYGSFGTDCATEATSGQGTTPTPFLYEPINVVFLDLRAQNATEAQEAVRNFMANQTPLFEPSGFHSSGYSAVFGAGASLVNLPQFPAGQTWSDGNFLRANNHGRTFGAFEWTQNGRRVFVSTGAFSREGGFDLQVHDFIGFNCARDALRARAGWTDAGRRDFGNANPTGREGCTPAGERFITADHDGVRVFVRN